MTTASRSLIDGSVIWTTSYVSWQPINSHVSWKPINSHISRRPINPHASLKPLDCRASWKPDQWSQLYSSFVAPLAWCHKLAREGEYTCGAFWEAYNSGPLWGLQKSLKHSYYAFIPESLLWNLLTAVQSPTMKLFGRITLLSSISNLFVNI